MLEMTHRPEIRTPVESSHLPTVELPISFLLLRGPKPSMYNRGEFRESLGKRTFRLVSALLP